MRRGARRARGAVEGQVYGAQGCNGFFNESATAQEGCLRLQMEGGQLFKLVPFVLLQNNNFERVVALLNSLTQPTRGVK